MINRRKYGIEFKKKIGRELSLGQSRASAISKREAISIPTLYKWRDKYGIGAESAKTSFDNEAEVRELRTLVAVYESALGEMALEIHLLKKIQEFASARERRKSLSGVISQSISRSKIAVR